MKTTTKIVLAVVTVLFLYGYARAGQQVTYQWTAPTAGSPVAVYQVQVSTDGGINYSTVAADVTGTQYTFDLEYGTEYTVRVAGVDSLGRRGPWSAPSDPYTPDLGPPGAPGKPTIIQILAGFALLLLGLILGRRK